MMFFPQLLLAILLLLLLLLLLLSPAAGNPDRVRGFSEETRTGSAAARSMQGAGL